MARRGAAILKDDGTIWVIGSYHNIYRVGSLLQDADFWILNDIVWRKSNPMPNFRGTRFTNAHETLIWCAKDEKARYTFNYRAMKALNDDLQMRSDWVLPICSGGGAGQGRRRRQGPPDAEARGACSTGSCSPARSRATWCSIPFFGTGTTGAVARRLGRRWIGIEREPAYVKVARERIASTLAARRKRDADGGRQARRSRASLSACWSRAGMVPPGPSLTDAKRRWTAKVRADGSIACDGTCGLDPQGRRGAAGRAVLQRLDLLACRGGGSLQPIDALRQQHLCRAIAAAMRTLFVRPLSSIPRSAMTARSLGSRAG